MTATGKTHRCLCCSLLLTQKRHASGRIKWYTPDGRWHHTNKCNFGRWKTMRYSRAGKRSLAARLEALNQRISL